MCSYYNFIVWNEIIVVSFYATCRCFYGLVFRGQSNCSRFLYKLEIISVTGNAKFWWSLEPYFCNYWMLWDIARLKDISFWYCKILSTKLLVWPVPKPQELLKKIRVKPLKFFLLITNYICKWIFTHKWSLT